MIPSFGGYTADNTGTEIADSCTNVSSIAAAYENVITTYNVTRIDLDTEDNSLTNTAGIDRRNKAIKMVEDWAAANGRTVQFSYTLPTTTERPGATGLAVLQNAVSQQRPHRHRQHHDVRLLRRRHPRDGQRHRDRGHRPGRPARLAVPGARPRRSCGPWSASPRCPASTTTARPRRSRPPTPRRCSAGPQSKGIAELSFWALQRDNGGCAGTGGSDTCSGIAQSTWYFSNTFEPFTSGITPPRRRTTSP